MTNEHFVQVKLTMTKHAVGAPLAGGEFSFGLFDHHGAELYTTTNSANGQVIFPAVRFSQIGEYNYTVKETTVSEDWDTDPTVWPVKIEVYKSGDKLHAKVYYPNGVPVFTNTHKHKPCCGAFKFPAQQYTAPGVYEYTLKELTPSGDGWQTDSKVVPVVVVVEDDGHGHLVAFVEYPEGFPTFKNKYHASPVCVTIHGCKIAIGAPLPEGKFEFGLFDEEGNLIATATNAAAAESIGN